MFGAVALLAYFLICLAICAAVAIYVAYPARQRDLPGRLRAVGSRPEEAVRSRSRRRTHGDQRVAERSVAQRG